MKIIIDGKVIIDRKTLFQQLKTQVNSQEFYGDNLDALWDVLSYMDKELHITIMNQNDLEENLGEYAKSLLKVFYDLKNINGNVSINME